MMTPTWLCDLAIVLALTMGALLGYYVGRYLP
jgi:uncharacterized protein YneF (UPF0154 family)